MAEAKKVNPFLKPKDVGTNPFARPKKVPTEEELQSGAGNSMPSVQEKEATLPEPHDYMFAQMDDADARTYYNAYATSEFASHDDQGNLTYKGKPVPKPEGNTDAAEALTGSWLTNPAGKALAWAMDDPEIAKASQDTMGGALNSVKSGLEIGGALLDKGVNAVTGMFSDEEPTPEEPRQAPIASAIQENFPEYNPEGTQGHLSAAVGNITTGIAVGNKVLAMSKMAGMTEKAAVEMSKYVPSWIAKVAAAVTIRAPVSAAGVAVATPTGSDKLFVGKDAAIPILQGLDDKTADEATNIVNDRLNSAADALLTILPVEGIAAGGKKIFQKMIGERVFDPLKMLVSPKAQEKAVANEIMAITASLAGAKNPDEIVALHKKLSDLLKNKGKQTIEGTELALPTMNEKSVKLDPTTMVSKEYAGSADVSETGTVEALKKYRNNVLLERKNAGLTEHSSESIERGLKDVTQQTSEAFGGPGGKNVTEGLGKVQDIAREQEAALGIGKAAAKDEAVQTSGKMVKNIEASETAKTKQLDDLYKAIPDDAGYDTGSFNKVVADAEGSISKKIQKIIDKSDGTWKYLNNTLKPALSAEITRVGKNPQPGEDMQDLIKIKKNIEETQIEYLSNAKKDAGGKFKKLRPDVEAAAKEAKDFGKKEVFPDRQGPFGKLKKNARDNALNDDEKVSAGRKVLNDIIDNVEEPEHGARLRKILADPRGGNSEELVAKYTQARDKAAFIEEQEKQLYQIKFKDFFQAKGLPAENARNSFKQMLEGPESEKIIKEMIDSKDPVLKDALKSRWMDEFEKSVLDLHRTQPSGAPKMVLNQRDLSQLYKYGDQIYADHPKVIPFLKDLVDTGREVAQARGMRAAPGGISTIAEKAAREAGTKVITIQAGRLTHKAAIENALFGIMVTIPNVNKALMAIKDKAMSDPDELARIISKWDAPDIKPGRAGRELAQWVLNTAVRDDSSTNKFEQDVRMHNTEEQTKKLLAKKKTKIDRTVSTGAEVIKQTSDWLGLGRR